MDKLAERGALNVYSEAYRPMRFAGAQLAIPVSNDATSQVVSTEGVGFLVHLRPALLRYFRRKSGSAVEAEDLTQDVIVRALTHAHWRSEQEARGYVFRSAVNRWRDRSRRLHSHGLTVAWDEGSAYEMGAENSPERVLLGEEQLNQVYAILRALSPRARNVLIMVKLENMKLANIAATLGVSVRTVSNDLTAAVARLAELRGK